MELSEVEELIADPEDEHTLRELFALPAQAEYFADDPELAQEFDENPLEDSFNYKLTVELSANTKEVREAIGKVEGVRMVSDLSELK